MGTTENESAWSVTAATNANADSNINWAEGMDPGAVNNSARSMMAARAKARLDQSGGLTAGGSANALTATTNQVLSSGQLTGGLRLCLKAASANTSTSVTFAPDGLTAQAIKRADGSALAVGSIQAGMFLDLVYNSGSSEWWAANIPPNASALGSAQASFSANKNGVNQSIPNGVATKLTFTTEAWDIGGYYDAPNSKWVPPAGTVLISAAVESLLNAGKIMQIFLAKNGVGYQDGGTLAVVNTSSTVITGCWLAQANGTDYFEIFFQQFDTVSQNAIGTASATYFQGTMI